MVEVTKSNFEDMMPEIEETIKNASFIGNFILIYPTKVVMFKSDLKNMM